MYDAIHDGGSQLSDFQITPALRKSCMLFYQRYKLELEKNAEEKASNSADLKRKTKYDEMQKVKEQRIYTKDLRMVSSRRYCLPMIIRIFLQLRKLLHSAEH